MKDFEELVEVIKKLRDPNDGCPWDLKQDHKSLLKYLIEESYEFIAAAEQDNKIKMQEELGDVLLQILLHAQIGSETNDFNINSISKVLKDKLIERHPHVFDEEFKKKNKEISSEEVVENWKIIKEKNKSKKTTSLTYNEKDLCNPSLTSSYNIGKKSTKVNFDWENYGQVVYKVEEEWQELKEVLSYEQSIDKIKAKEEIGDLLFSVAQLARHLNLEPEECLRHSNIKFIKRFSIMENLIKNKNLDFADLSFDEKEHLWYQAKVQLREKK